MKIFLSVVLVFLSVAVLGQLPSTLPFRGDTIKLYKVGGSTELIIANKTKDSLGIARNAGGGRLEYVKPRQLTDTTILIGYDTLNVGSGSGLSSAEVQALIDASLAVQPVHMDPTYFDGDGTTLTPYTPIVSVFAFQTDIDDLTTRIDSIIGAWPLGPGSSSRTNILNFGDGDSVMVKVNDSLWKAKTLKAGTNVTFTITDSTITINGVSGTAEVNTTSFTLATTGNRTIADESILQYVLVKPVSNLAGFKVGTLSVDDAFVPATPVLATAEFVVFDVGAYIASSTAIYFSGITSSTQIKMITKPIHE